MFSLFLKVVSICKFEEHAGSTARHASDFIILENGRSLRDVLEAGKRVAPDRFSDVIRKAIEFSSHRGCLACRKCRGNALRIIPLFSVETISFGCICIRLHAFLFFFSTNM
jgi:hypothetical protein